MKENVLLDLSKEFAKEIIFLCREIKVRKTEYTVTNQLLRSGTSIGANIHEAQYAQSKNDFVSKFEIALKECYESEYWLELLFETDSIDEQKYAKMKNDCGKIRRLLIASCKTIKENIGIRTQPNN